MTLVTYTTPATIVSDIEAGDVLWTSKGRVRAVLVNSLAVTNPGFVLLFIRNFTKLNSVAAEAQFAYTLAQLPSVQFIKNLEGLSLYLNTIDYAGAVGTIVPGVGNSGDTLAAKFGTYEGASAGNYVVTVTTPGAADGSTAEVTITGPTGDAGPFTFKPNSGVAFNVGTKGVQLRLTEGISGTLTSADDWTLPVTTSPTNITSWEALTQPQRDQYDADANVLIQKNQFVPNWPTTTQLA